MLRLVAFDLDGTIGDTVAMSMLALRETAAAYLGREAAETETAATLGFDERGALARLLGRDCPRAVADFLAAYSRLHDICPHPFGGIPQLIGALRQHGIITALVTGKGAESCGITLRRFGLRDAFDRILTGSPVRNIKAGNLRALLGEYGLQPDEAIYIGDTLSDVWECRKAGICCLTAAWASSYAERRQCMRINGGRVFISVKALASHVLAIAQRNAMRYVSSQK